MIRLACVLRGGPDRIISVDGTLYKFEVHPYFAPALLDRRGNPVDYKPRQKPVYAAVSLWKQQGERIDEATGLCVWDRGPKPILEHLGSRNYLVTGFEPAIRGK